MFIKLYYQDFKLNAGVFNDDQLVLDEANSKLVASFNDFEFKRKLEAMGIDYVEDASMNDICNMLFKAFNLYPIECCTEHLCFEEIGHTSMSIGDYVVIENYGEADVLMCAPSGWYGVGTLEGFQQDREKIINRMMKLPVRLIRAMLPSVICEGVMDADGEHYYEFKRIMTQFLDLRCENQCPRCHGEKIDWGMKDYSDSLVFQNAKCEECGLDFTEEYCYTRTSVNEELETEIKSGE